jgi:hypothetical protein
MEPFNPVVYESELMLLDRHIQAVQDEALAAQIRERVQRILALSTLVFREYFRIHPEQSPTPQSIEDLMGPAGMG